MKNLNNTIDSGKKILIVEDEASLRNALSKKLENIGISVFEANDGIDGLEIALKIRPDLILLDVAMPRMDGFEMLKKLRENAWGKYVSVIMLTNLEINDQLLSEVMVGQPSYYLVKGNTTLDRVLDKIHEVFELQKKESQLISDLLDYQKISE